MQNDGSLDQVLLCFHSLSDRDPRFTFLNNLNHYLDEQR